MMRVGRESVASLLLMRCDRCDAAFRFCVDTFVEGKLVAMFPLSPDQLSQLVALFSGSLDLCRGCGAAVDQTAWRKWAGRADEVTV
jgi:hypothetical protein